MKPRGQLLELKPAALLTKEKLLRLKGSFMNSLSSLSSLITSKLSNLRRPDPQRSFEVGDRRNRSFKKYLPYIVLGVFGVIFLAGLSYGTYHIFKNITQGNKISVLGAKANQDLGNEFTFPLYDAEGQEVSRLKFVIEKAELRDEIIVKGQRARSVSGRTFLTLIIKITNDYTLPMELKSKDYVRLSVNDSAEWLAPDVHSDPLEVQSQSTKVTRIGFAINDSDKNLKIRVGEINGEKTEIPLSLE